MGVHTFWQVLRSFYFISHEINHMIRSSYANHVGSDVLNGLLPVLGSLDAVHGVLGYKADWDSPDGSWV